MKPQHIVNVSGGKDSSAVYLLALERGVPFRAVFADTGNEHPLTYEYVRSLHLKTGGPKVEEVKADFTVDLARKREFILNKWPAHGVPMERVARAAELMRPTGNPYLDMCIWKGRFPSRMAQFCTEELKTWPITDQIILPSLRNGPVVQWLGIRAEESRNRAKQPRFNRHESGSVLWRPIFKWTLEDVWAMHRKHGMQPNPLYSQGMGRVGCMPCVNCRKSELNEIATRFPEHIDRIREWEAIVTDASKRHGATFFSPLLDSTPNQIDTVVEWSKTGRGGRQYQMFFEQQTGGGCNSDLGMCEREAA